MGDMYKYNLNSYIIPPLHGNVTLKQLEELSLERLELYKILNMARTLRPFSSKWLNNVKEELDKSTICKHYIPLLDDSNCSANEIIAARKADHIAHWFMRLLYSNSSSKIEWFIQRELEWFYVRYKQTDTNLLNEFLQQNHLNIPIVTGEEKNLLRQQLLCSTTVRSNFDETVFRKTSFANILSLLEHRKVYMAKGFAYFPDHDLFQCVRDQLQRQWLRQLSIIGKTYSSVLKDDRVVRLLDDLPIVYSSDDVDEINPEHINRCTNVNIDWQARSFFPLCMRVQHEAFREQHHLKYDCKMQLGIFLKTIGMPYEEALDYWQGEFTKIMSDELYNRKYAYLFKHHYGKVGGNSHVYKPYTCQQLINSNVGAVQEHGCPFKTWNTQKLYEKLSASLAKSNAQQIQCIIESVARSKYQEACTQCFNVINNRIYEKTIETPHEYYLQSNWNDWQVDGVISEFFIDLDTEHVD